MLLVFMGHVTAIALVRVDFSLNIYAIMCKWEAVDDCSNVLMFGCRQFKMTCVWNILDRNVTGIVIEAY